MREEKIYYFLSESLLEELPNINHFTSKLILIKSILIELILSKINSINAEPNTHYMMHEICNKCICDISLQYGHLFKCLSEL